MQPRTLTIVRLLNEARPIIPTEPADPVTQSRKIIIATSPNETRLTFPTEPADSVLNKFKQGDLLFGLRGPCDALGSELVKKGFHHIYANTLNAPAVDLALKSGDKTQAIRKLDDYQYKHYYFLNERRTYLLRKPGKPIPNVGINSPAYRRACKLLLINRKDKNNHAHFITDKMDMARVCDKTQSRFSVTGSEMRAAYRDYCNKGINPHIFFYDQDNKLLARPPWKNRVIAHHWRQYDELRHKKRVLKKLQEKLGVMPERITFKKG